MPAESYTPDPALVELVARVAYEADSKQILGDEQLTWDEQPEQCHDWFRAIARAVLAALATEGRLLPADATERTEWAVRVDEPHPARKEKRGDLITRLPAENARRAPDIWAGWTTVCRTIRTWHGWRWVGPWLPAPTKTEETP